MDDRTIATALAEAMKDPRHFRELLSMAATLASGGVEEFTFARTQEPITVGSAGFWVRSGDDVVVGWEYDTSIRFKARVLT